MVLRIKSEWTIIELFVDIIYALKFNKNFCSKITFKDQKYLRPVQSSKCICVYIYYKKKKKKNTALKKFIKEKYDCPKEKVKFFKNLVKLLIDQLFLFL